MSGRASLGRFTLGGVEIRGNVTSVQAGGVDRPHEANADGSVDFHEINVPASVVVEASYVPSVKLKAIMALKEKEGIMQYSNGVKLRFPKMSFSTKDTIGAEGKISLTFMGEAAQE